MDKVKDKNKSNNRQQLKAVLMTKPRNSCGLQIRQNLYNVLFDLIAFEFMRRIQ